MSNLAALISTALAQVWATFQHNWPFLLVSAFIAAGMKLYLNQEAIGSFLRRHQRGGVLAATAVAVATPLCSCGTTAVILGMLAGSLPWAPIIAFMVASPLTSPEGLIYSAGLFGWPFALAFFGASILLGLGGGGVAHVLDRRGWLAGQARYRPAATGSRQPVAPTVRRATSAAITFAPTGGRQLAAAAGGCCAAPTSSPIALTLAPAYVPSVQLDSAPAACGCAAGPADAPARSSAAPDWRAFGGELLVSGRQLLIFFFAFAFIGYLLNDLIPATWIPMLFGKGRGYSVPLAATLGLPFYLNTEASLPLVRAMLDGGMSAGAALAFLITGAGTSIGALAGALAIARWRVLAVVIAVLWLGAILCGLTYDGMIGVVILP
jgi:uncharacterized protein